MGITGRFSPATSSPGSGATPDTKAVQTGADLRGASRLVVDAVAGVTDLVEAMHRNIAGLSPIVGAAPTGGMGGIPGLVYRSVRGVTRAVGFGLDVALSQLAPLLGNQAADTAPRREVVLAALNGVLGDYLAASRNPLVITMTLRRNGKALVLERSALASALDSPTGKLLVLAHGLCMNDRQWDRQGHDHGAGLARDLGYTPVYLYYNTGRPIGANGAELAGLLEDLVREWPVPVSELVILGHSMGGLVARSACQRAELDNLSWRRQLTSIVFLGTPHHGAPLERAGSWVDLLLGVSPYTAPFARLGMIRSAGIQDLRHGNILDSGAGHVPAPGTGIASGATLPAGVYCFAVAASKQAHSGAPGKRLRGDGLVPVLSALGRHKDAQRRLEIPDSNQHVCFGLNHFDLLSSADVYAQIRRWLEAT